MTNELLIKLAYNYTLYNAPDKVHIDHGYMESEYNIDNDSYITVVVDSNPLDEHCLLALGSDTDAFNVIHAVVETTPWGKTIIRTLTLKEWDVAYTYYTSHERIELEGSDALEVV